MSFDSYLLFFVSILCGFVAKERWNSRENFFNKLSLSLSLTAHYLCILNEDICCQCLYLLASFLYFIMLLIFSLHSTCCIFYESSLDYNFTSRFLKWVT
jgi:hypothetical protein